MDPNANLREQREIAARLIARNRTVLGANDVNNALFDAVRLAELVQALDQWILGGGFLPDFWEQASGRRRYKGE